MNHKSVVRLAALFLLLACFVARAQTDGNVSFTVGTKTANGNYAPSHVFAIWVTDANTNFIKTLKRMGNTRKQYLVAWNSTVGSYTNVDGMTGATLNQHQIHTVTWNARNTNNAVVPDGVYRIFVEFTENNAAGPLASTSSLSFYKGASAVTSTPPNLANFTNMQIVYLPAAIPNTTIPGTLQAEDYSSAFDTTVGNDGGVYRSGDVDIEVCAEGGYDVGWITATEWLEFIADVSTGGLYDLRFRVSSADSTARSLHVEVDGTNVTGSVAFNTGGAGWQVWTNAWASNITLHAGARRVRIVMDTGSFNLNYMAVTRSPAHDLAVAGISSPAFIPPGSAAGIVVTVTNRGDYTESFTVALTNTTDHVLIGSQAAAALPAGGRTNVAFTWNTATASTGFHWLVASAGPVAGESQTADNVATATVLVAQGLTTNKLVTKGSAWRYNDEGLDLSGTPWKQESYYDALWNSGPAVLGFGNGGEGTVLANVAAATSAYSLLNASFELPGAGGAGTASNWNGEAQGGIVMGGSWGDASRESWRAHNGSWQGTTHDWGSSGDGAGFWQQVTNDLGAGSIWTADIWAWNDNGMSGIYFTNVSGTYTLKIEWYDGAQQFITQSAAGIPLPGEIWTRGSVQGVAPVGAAWARLVVGVEAMSSSGALQLDDASLRGLRPGRTTWYFRRDAYVDTTPVSAVFNVRRDDGIVIYVNSAEVLRDGLPEGTLTGASYATNAIVGSAETNYISRSFDATTLKPGRNVIAAEVHQAPGAETVDLAFDLELAAVMPTLSLNHEVAVDSLHLPENLLAGDRGAIAVSVTNGGQAVETFVVILVDTNTGAVIGSQVVSNLVAGGVTEVRFDWNTLGVAAGPHGIAAYTVLGGVTNYAGSATGSALLHGAGFGPDEVLAVGSIGGLGRAVATAGGYVYLGEGATLTVLLAGDSPARLGSIRLPGLIRDVEISGTTVFTAAGEAGVQIVSVTNTSMPSHIGSFNTSGHAYDLALAGGSLYIADGVSGLRIVDIADPSAPSLLGSYSTVGPARGVAVSGSSAYVLDEYDGLLVLDVSTPSSPVLLSRDVRAAFGEDIAISGTRAYITDGNGYFSVFDISAGSTNVLLGRMFLPAAGRKVAVNGAIVYIAAGAMGVLSVDTTTPGSMSVVMTSDTPGEAFDVSVASPRSYVADGASGLQVFNAATPAAPAFVGAYTAGGRARDVLVTNGLAYVAGGAGGLRIYSVTNPATPTLRGSISGPASSARGLAVAGSIAYVADGENQLAVVDISSATAPIQIGGYTNPLLGAVHAIAVAGQVAVVTDGSVIESLNVSVPSAPVTADSYNPEGYVYDVAARGTIVLAAAGNAGLLVFDVSNPSALAYLGSCSTPGMAVGVAWEGSNALVACADAGWVSVDLSTPSSPSVSGSFAGDGPVVDVAVFGPLAQLAGGAVDVKAMDVSVPLTPVSKAAFAPLVRAMKVAAAGPYAFVAEDEGGLSIFDTSPGDFDLDRMPDTWEQAIADADAGDLILGPADVNPLHDFDEDGQANLFEYLAGTSATDPSSLFAIATTQSAPGSSYVVRWHSVGGRNYTLYKSTNLMAGFSALQSGIAATEPMNSWTDTVTSAEAAYYMVGTGP